MIPRILNRKAAAEYLGMSVDTFDDLVRPRVPVINIGISAKGYRWDTRDLDNYIDAMPKIYPAGVGSNQETTKCENRNRMASSCAVGSGISNSRSGMGNSGQSFENRLDIRRKIEQRRKSSEIGGSPRQSTG
ncbi:hypothetical protein CCP4SC76_4480001 [Gammaproteobacteria bacterium]